MATKCKGTNCAQNEGGEQRNEQLRGEGLGLEREDEPPL